MVRISPIIAAALIGFAALGFASASIATPEVTEIKEGSSAAHSLLIDAIKDNGVNFYVNHSYCGKDEGLMGFYAGKNRVLVVCQDNGVPGGPVVEWTANDLDTLRHEAQHMIQDCIVGTNHDHELAPVYKSPAGLAQRVIGAEAIARITEIYREKGASDLVLLLEYEAFAVAAMNVPAEQTQDVAKYCGAN